MASSSSEISGSKKGLSLTSRVLLATLATVVVVVGANYAVFMTDYASDARDAWVEKASAFTATADEAKNRASEMHLAGSINSGKLLEEARAHMDSGGSYVDTKYFDTIPVIVGWETARAAAIREGIDFEMVSFEARNNDNAPEPGSFREQLLRELTESVERGGEQVISSVNKETNTLHYMRAIRLDASCMGCHGDPAVYDQRDEEGNYDGKDPLGFAMEGWDEGYMHGAYEVAMPLGPIDAQVGGFFLKGMGVTLPIALIGFGAFFYLLRRTMTLPLQAIVERMKALRSGDADLTVELNARGRDELADVAESFNMFMQTMRVLVSDVRNGSTAVAGASTEIAATIEQMATGLGHQNEQAHQVSAAVEEMSHSVAQVAEKSRDASGTAQSSSDAASNGGSIVGSTVDEVQQIATEVRASSERVSLLGRKSEEIGEIVGVINDIADQTNLLALNAAIEAARAGEHGRGFAVVADEVRKLAERTTQATEQVSASIREIQDETRGAVEQIESGSSRASRGVELARDAGNALDEILQSSESTVEMVRQIAAATDEQSSASGTIAQAVEEISAVTRESSQGAAQASQAASDLAAQAERLHAIVARFRLGEDEPRG